MIRSTFVIDLARCTGCDACAIACKDRAGLPDDVDWLHVHSKEGGAYPHVRLTYRPVHCFHCADPACAAACPVDAIARQDDGHVIIDEATCIGCGACVDACPFGAITLTSEQIATKCDGCAAETARGERPVCVRACPLRALGWGHNALADRPRVLDDAFDDHGIGPAVRYLRRP
jgi:anaerobic dimethyl sulfoxide reductase subunit B (iron-sulfur subunit)